jgi:serine/threonine protein kinase
MIIKTLSYQVTLNSIIDPGFAKTLESFRKDSKSKPQNFFYVAPQVLEPKPKYTNKCDIWSLGMVLFECVTGVLPFYASTNDEHLKFCKSKKIEVPENVVSKNMKSFIEGCLVY